MMRAVLTIASILLVASGVAGLLVGDGAWTREQASEMIARECLTNGSTFRFDGVRDSLTLTNTVKLRIQDGWQYNFRFECAHSGYGDRSGQKLLQVVSPHTAMVQVIRGKVVRAILDNAWDELRQVAINVPVLER